MTNFTVGPDCPAGAPIHRVSYFVVLLRLRLSSPLVDICVLPLASTALLVNSIAVILLCRRRLRRGLGALHPLLLLLSASEVAFCFSNVFLKALDLSDVYYPHAVAALECLFDGLHSARNWAVTLMVLARTEVVLYPLRALHSPCLSRNRLLPIHLVLSLIGIAVAAVRIWGVLKFRFCTAPADSDDAQELGGQEGFFLPDKESGANLLDAVLGLAFKRALPVLLVLLGSIMISVTLRKRSQRFKDASSASYRATVTVLVLAILFLILEGSHFVYYSVAAAGLVPRGPHSFYVNLANQIFMMIDSLLNPAAYMAVNPTVRTEIKTVFASCICRCNIRPTRTSVGDENDRDRARIAVYCISYTTRGKTT